MADVQGVESDFGIRLSTGL